MNICADHLQDCFDKAVQDDDLPWSADPDARRVYVCITALADADLEAWTAQRKGYAAACHTLFAQLRRDGLAFTARILQEQAKAKAKARNALPLMDQPKFVLLAHLFACLGPDLSKIGIVESLLFKNPDLTIENKVETIISGLLTLQSLDQICFLGLRALAQSEWFRRYAESLLEMTRKQAKDQSDVQAE